MSRSTWCRLGAHRWVLWPRSLRVEPGESAYYCERCGRQPRLL